MVDEMRERVGLRLTGAARERPVVVMVVGLVCLAAAPVSAQVTLDAMTFNIRTSNGRDGENSWSYRKDLVVDTIERFAPQVVGLQEALDEQIEYLDTMLPDYRWLGIDRGLNGGFGLSESTPIFYRHGQLSPIESGNFWLTSTPDVPPQRPTGDRRRRGGGRIVTWARFHHRETGRQVYVFNTHFTLRRGASQLDSADLIATRVAALPEGTAVVAMGDFNNSAEDSDTWRVATSRGLRDAWLLADERRGPTATYGDFRPPGDDLTERVDWILVAGPIGVRFVETVLHNEGGRYPSDHYPVVARLVVE
jgi:endonuclease/exonuclease/phosphatase family metal-dependent hydrolase